jgi:DNA-binding transcriptional MerR regulator
VPAQAIKQEFATLFPRGLNGIQETRVMKIQKPDKKLYYTLGQVTAMLGVEKSDVKQWEKEFRLIKPVRNRAGNRNYLERDLPVLFYIKELLHDKRLTIDEAKEELRKLRKKDIASETLHLKKLLAEMKMEVGEVRKLLNNGQ